MRQRGRRTTTGVKDRRWGRAAFSVSECVRVRGRWEGVLAGGAIADGGGWRWQGPVHAVAPNLACAGVIEVLVLILFLSCLQCSQESAETAASGVLKPRQPW